MYLAVPLLKLAVFSKKFDNVIHTTVCIQHVFSVFQDINVLNTMQACANPFSAKLLCQIYCICTAGHKSFSDVYLCRLNKLSGR